MFRADSGIRSSSIDGFEICLGEATPTISLIIPEENKNMNEGLLRYEESKEERKEEVKENTYINTIVQRIREREGALIPPTPRPDRNRRGIDFSNLPAMRVNRNYEESRSPEVQKVHLDRFFMDSDSDGSFD